jgi:hypothetical protein
MADKNYYPQPQGDSSAADAAKHTIIHSFELAANGLSAFYYVGNARHVYWIAEKSSCSAVIRGQGGDGAPTNVYAAYKNGTATPTATAYSAAATPQSPGQLGMISQDHMPYEFALVNTDGSNTSKVTLYINY